MAMSSVPKTSSKTKTTPSNTTPGQPSIPENSVNELDLSDSVIEIRNLKFSYSKSKGNLLNNFSLTFPRGAIYGFLGPSGCGKTTLTKLIVGLLKPKSGSIKVNGRPIDDQKNLIPGPGVGYMPQDTALFEEFSIYETLKYFSELYGIPKKERNDRIEYLIGFLDLPDKNRMVGVLSGGQKRRTSLAVSIIHKPPLLIMDEPTVGIDPLMREKIWQHLMKLSAENKTSILITTHYIEECRRAHVIALMRSGKLLAENSPNVLLTHFKTNNLEDVFLQTCKLEDGQTQGVTMPPVLSEVQQKNGGAKPSKKIVPVPYRPSKFGRLKCLFIKNLTMLYRNVILLALEILLPMVALILFALAVGNKPTDLDIALYSEERLNTSQPNDRKLSETLLQQLDKDTFKLIDYTSAKGADDSVRNGETYGAIHVGSNFTSALQERLQRQMTASDQVINQSTIPFNGDLSDLVIYQTVLLELFGAMLKFLAAMMSTMAKMSNDSQTTFNPNILKPNVELVDPPVYGSVKINFRDFLHPSFLLLCAFCISMAMTSLTMIQERMKGLLDRTLVAGASLCEILGSLVLIQTIVLVLQTAANLLVTLVIFDFYNIGNPLLIYISVLLQGVCGITVGVAISMTFHDMDMAIMIVAGVLMPNLVISGIVWPIESMDDPIRYISYPLPQTLPVKALRAIILKGWSLDKAFIWFGLMVSILWSLLFFIYSIIIANFV